MSKIVKWEQRLNRMDTSKGVSNVMRQTCMQEEIEALRAAHTRLTKSRDAWKKVAQKYRKRLLAAGV